LTDNRHNFYVLANKPVINALNTADASAIPRSNFVYRGIQERLLRYLIEPFEESEKIRVGLFHTVDANAPLMDADKVGLGFL